MKVVMVGFESYMIINRIEIKRANQVKSVSTRSIFNLYTLSMLNT